MRRRLADRSDIAPRRDVPFHRRGHTREQSTACETNGGGLIRRVIPAPRRWCRLSFAFRGFRNDGILPVICLTSQIVVVESRRRATAKPTAKLLCIGLFSRFGVRGPRRPWLSDRNSRAAPAFAPVSSGVGFDAGGGSARAVAMSGETPTKGTLDLAVTPRGPRSRLTPGLTHRLTGTRHRLLTVC